MNQGPIFIGGLARSGKTYLRLMLSAHSQIATTRRTNLWPRYYARYGDLGREWNFERCLAAMAGNKHIQALTLDWQQLRQEFWQGSPTYGRLFALVQEQYARQSGKSRWADQTEFVERFARPIFAAYPTARILHLIRDPRDQYAAAASQKGRHQDRVGLATAHWRYSATLAGRHEQTYPGRYKVIRYESMVQHPEKTLRDICHFLGEAYEPAMLTLEEVPRFQKAHRMPGTSPLSAAFIGRYQQSLSPFEVAFIERFAGALMQQYGYRPGGPAVEEPQQRLYQLGLNLARLAGWNAFRTFQDVQRVVQERRLAMVPQAAQRTGRSPSEQTAEGQGA